MKLKNYSFKNAFVTPWLTLFLAFAPFLVEAQIVTIINSGVAGTSAYNCGPVYRSSATSGYDASRYCYLYTQSELASAGITSGAIISEVGWTKNNNATATGPADFNIYMKNTATASFSNSTETWANLNSGATLTYQSTSFVMPATQAPDYINFTLSAPFVYTGGSLEICTEWDISAVAGSPTTGTFEWLWSTVPDRIYGTGQTVLANAGTLSSTTNSISTLDDRRPFIRIVYMPGTPCTSPPNPGTAVTNPSGPVCPGQPVDLNLTGITLGTGQTYQWQSSAVVGGPFINFGSSSSTTKTTVSPTTSTYYRAAVTCSGNTQFSTPVQVVVNSGFPGGVYTIDAGSPASATNFQSFQDAVNAIACGITGPVVFNVAPNSGPYVEQVIMPSIGGVSLTNTITFNCNGNKLETSLTSTSERANFKLDGTDYVTIDSLVIDVSAGTYGFGIQLINGADNNTIKNCHITTSTTSTSSTDYAGIVVNSSATSISTAGASICDSNIITANTIIGGYTGIALVGNSSSSTIKNNEVTDNNILDFYYYGIYLNGGEHTLIEGNDLSRPSRTNVSNFNGIFLTGNSTNTKISKNRLHNPFDGELTETGGAFAIYLTGCDAIAGNENIVSNNLIYDFFGGAGNQNGFLNVGSDYVKYYYNTVSLTDAAASCSTCGTRGWYMQSPLADGLEFKNNIINIDRGGTGPKQAIYFEVAGIVFTADNNDYHISSPAGLVEIGYVNGAGQSTLAQWQTASAQDANSTDADPVLDATVPGVLIPTAVAVDDIAAPISITDDILGNARDAVNPDPGAFEFTVPPCDVPIPAVVSNITVNGADINWDVVMGVSGYQYALTMIALPPLSGTSITDTFYNASGLSASTTYYFHLLSDCGPGGLSSWVTTSFVTADCNPPAAAFSNITGYKADVSWNRVTGADDYEYEISTNASPPLSGTRTTDTSYNATNLTPNTTYYFHLRSFCGGDTSLWSTGDFTTVDITSVQAFDKNEGFSIITYPNPVSNTLTVMISAPATQYELTLVSITGKELYKVSLKGNKAEVDMSDFGSGIYFLQYTSDSHNETVRVTRQ